LRNSLGQENLCDLTLIACDGPLPIDKWLVSGNGGLHLNGTRKKFFNVLMKTNTSKWSVVDFDYELAVNMWKEKKAIKTNLINNILKHFCSLVFSCYRYK